MEVGPAGLTPLGIEVGVGAHALTRSRAHRWPGRWSRSARPRAGHAAAAPLSTDRDDAVHLGRRLQGAMVARVPGLAARLAARPLLLPTRTPPRTVRRRRLVRVRGALRRARDEVRHLLLKGGEARFGGFGPGAPVDGGTAHERRSHPRFKLSTHSGWGDGLNDCHDSTSARCWRPGQSSSDLPHRRPLPLHPARDRRHRQPIRQRPRDTRDRGMGATEATAAEPSRARAP